MIPRTPFYGIEPSTLPPLPQGARENEGFDLKMPLSRKKVLSLMRNRDCPNVAPNHSVRNTQLNTLLLPLTECITWFIFLTIILKLAAGGASKATPMGVPAPLSLFLYLKERWWVWGGGGRRFEAKQTARVSTLKVNTTLCLNYTPSALQFSHTLALSPLSLIPANTPLSRPS